MCLRRHNCGEGVHPLLSYFGTPTDSAVQISQGEHETEAASLLVSGQLALLEQFIRTTVTETAVPLWRYTTLHVITRHTPVARRSTMLFVKLELSIL